MDYWLSIFIKKNITQWIIYLVKYTIHLFFLFFHFTEKDKLMTMFFLACSVSLDSYLTFHIFNVVWHLTHWHYWTHWSHSPDFVNCSAFVKGIKGVYLLLVERSTWRGLCNDELSYFENVFIYVIFYFESPNRKCSIIPSKGILPFALRSRGKADRSSQSWRACGAAALLFCLH